MDTLILLLSRLQFLSGFVFAILCVCLGVYIHIIIEEFKR